MIVFLFYLVATLVLFSVIAIVADFIGWLYPGWDPGENLEQAATHDGEDAQATEGTVI